MVNDFADVTSSADRRPEKLGYQQSTVCWYIGTTRRLVPTERSDRRLDRSATRVKGPRYPGTSPWTTLYVNTAILNSILRDTQRQWRHASAYRIKRTPSQTVQKEFQT